MELQASELRRGNIIYKSGEFVTVQNIGLNDDPDMITVNLEGVGLIDVDVNECKPISITSDWLKEQGFTHPENKFENAINPYYVNNTVCLFYTQTPPEYTWLGGYGFQADNKYYAATFKWINYIHQIQNLYFILKGKELEIKELQHD